MTDKLEKIANSAKEIIDFGKQVEGLGILVQQHAQEEILNIKNNKKLKVLSISEIENIFGKFEYTDIGGGRIRIGGNWQNENIKLLQMGFRNVWVHKLIMPQTAFVFAKIQAEGLADELDLEYGGGFCARKKMWDSKRGLSLHAFGVAIDLNPQKYPYGSMNQPHPRVIEIFKEGGFFWGGNFSRVRDCMHFQYSFNPLP